MDNLIGKRFNHWTIIDSAEDRIDSSGKHHKRYLCECDCGTTVVKDYYKIKNGAKMCRKCYLKVLPNNGIPFEKKGNKYDLSGQYGIGWTSNTNEEFYFDIEDYDKIKDHTWYNSLGYVCTSDIDSKKSIRMHQIICCKGCDHKNRNKKDNRKRNLRPCSQAENTKNRTVGKNNTSGYIGVSFDKRQNKWVAYITCNGVRHSLGSFLNINDAIEARIDAQEKYFKDFSANKYKE